MIRAGLIYPLYDVHSTYCADIPSLMSIHIPYCVESSMVNKNRPDDRQTGMPVRRTSPPVSQSPFPVRVDR